MSSITYVGMDVHKNSFSLCAIDGASGEILSEAQCASEAKQVLKFVHGLEGRLGEKLTVKLGYEAGCLGYWLYQSLDSLRVDCEILAPSTMYHSAKNKVVKNDKADARIIAQNLANGTYKAVHVPDVQDIETKEYLRMVQATKKSFKRIKQMMKALVLRQGYKYEGKSAWTQAYFQWLQSLEMSDLLRETLNEYLLQYENLQDRIARFEARIVELSSKERYKVPIGHLRSFKGIDTLSAMTVQVEISDFSRFPSAKSFCAYLGLTPSEPSSGEKMKLGGITKQGNRLVKSTLIECSRSLVRGNLGHKSKRLIARQQGQPSEVIAYVDKAAERLQRKYSRLLYSGKAANKAITAIARELACFIWGLSTGHCQVL